MIKGSQAGAVHRVETGLASATATANAAAAAAAGAVSSAGSAVSLANSAQLSANGKNTIFYSSTTPTANAANDLWFTLDGSGHIVGLSKWSGSTWVAEALTSAVFAFIDAGVITAGVLSGITISGNTIYGGTVSTATSGQRWELKGSAVDSLKAYTGNGSETTPGSLVVSTPTLATHTYGNLSLNSPDLGHGHCSVQLQGGSSDGVLVPVAAISCLLNANDGIVVTGDTIKGGDTGALLDVATVAATDVTTGTGIGDKIGLFGASIGVGVQSARLVTYMGAASSLAVQQVAASGQKSSNTTTYRPVLASAFTVSSLRETKKAIRPLTGALDTINALNPVTARSNNDTHLPAAMRTKPFHVAQEVEAVDPALVSYEPTVAWHEQHGHKQRPPTPTADDLELVGNDLGAFIALHTKAIQELSAELAAVKAELAELKA